MLQDTLQHVLEYLDWLEKDQHLQIYLRPNEKYIGRLDSRLMRYNCHFNPYCLLLKQNRALWEPCIRGQEKVCQKCAQGEFFGMCHAGVEEFVYPLGPDYREKGFLSVSGYRLHPEKAQERIRTVSREYHLDAAAVEKMYRQYLNDTPPEKSQLDRWIHPLCDMLDLLFRQMDERDSSSDPGNNDLYDSVMRYLWFHYAEDISLQDLCEKFHCSPSSLSHLFKKRNGKSIRSHLNFLRMQEAAALLQGTDLPVQNIAALVGIPDGNYFSNLFRKEYGTSPMEWRALRRTGEREP